MTEFLCLGGPLHGQVLEVPEPRNGIRISPPSSAFLLRKGNEPMPQPIQYVLRPIGGDVEGVGRFVRPVMAVEQISPPQVMMLLADALVKEWLQQGGEQIDPGPDAGPGMPGADGSSGDGGTGAGLLAP